jgi:hypothetical protein
MGSVHYGDFVRRFEFVVSVVERELPVNDSWDSSIGFNKGYLCGIFDIKSENGVDIIVDLDGINIINYSVPPGHHAGIIYYPDCWFENNLIKFRITGYCMIKEIIIGILP